MIRSENYSLVYGVINIPIPNATQVYIEDIAHRLSNICRFNGATREFFPVGQHCLETGALCYAHAKEFNVDPFKAYLAGLLHDAPEYSYGDLITPVKKKIGGDYKKNLTIPADNAVYKGLGVTKIMEECHKIVLWADYEMLLSDAARWDVFGGDYVSPGGDLVYITEHNVVPEPYKLRYEHAIPMKPGEAKQPYIYTYNFLKDTLGLK